MARFGKLRHRGWRRHLISGVDLSRGDVGHVQRDHQQPFHAFIVLATNGASQRLEQSPIVPDYRPSIFPFKSNSIHSLGGPELPEYANPSTRFCETAMRIS